MQEKIYRFILKFKFFLPVGIAILLSVAVITYQSIQNSKKSILNILEKSLILEVETISKMFEREYNLKLQKVEDNLKIISQNFYLEKLIIDSEEVEILSENQVTGERLSVKINKWYLSDKNLLENNDFVDNIQFLIGGTATIFQKIDSGYIRISTNVLNSDSTRAIGTFIPNNSSVIETIEKGSTFFGRAFVVNDWYITAYEPIFIHDTIVGMLYVGNKEKDLPELRNILNNLKIGNSGQVYVLNESGDVIIHNKNEGENWSDKEIIKSITKEKNGIKYYKNADNQIEKIIAFNYFQAFGLYIIAEINEKEETSDLIKEIIRYSVFIAFIIIVLLSVFIFTLTYDKLYKYLKKIEITNQNLEDTKLALGLSEEKFRILFNNSSDEIYVADLKGNFIEVNQVACDTLGYTREQLLRMRFLDIKTDRFKPNVAENLNIIKEKSHHIYETEHLSASGEIMNIEMKSKIIDYEGKKAIMSMARNIGERKAVEKKIISTVIETEEKERKRFAAELHDGLGPILSTIKLYADLLKNKSNSNINNDELVQNIDELVGLAISTSKEISNNITPTILHDFGLASAIHEFCGYINKTMSINISVDTKNYTFDKRGLEETILYQATKELINNTLKHASAENVKIQLKNTETQIILYYRDDGKGFNVNEMIKNSTGLGLNNIVNKVKTIKGTCDFNSEEGKGMFVLIAVKV